MFFWLLQLFRTTLIYDLYVTIKGLAVCNLRGAPHSYESSSVREGDIDPWGVFLGRDWSILLLAAVWRVVRVQRRPRGNWSNTGVLCRLLNPPSVTKFLSEWALMCSIWSSHMKSHTRLLLINITYTNQLFPSSEVQWGCFRRSRGKPQTDQRSRIKAADKVSSSHLQPVVFTRLHEYRRRSCAMCFHRRPQRAAADGLSHHQLHAPTFDLWLTCVGARCVS